MKRRNWMIILCAGMLLVSASMPAHAFGRQAPAGTCGSPESVQGDFLLTPQSGPAGSTVIVSGSFTVIFGLSGDSATETGASAPSVSIAGPVVAVIWMDNGEILAELPTDIGNGETASFSGSIMIPADAAAGSHNVGFLPQGYTEPSCLSFEVTEVAVSQDAYIQSVTSLPATGIPPMAPAAGIIFLAAGALMWHTRRQLDSPDLKWRRR